MKRTKSRTVSSGDFIYSFCGKRKPCAPKDVTKYDVNLAVEIAQDFNYPQETINAIKRASSISEISRIMEKARLAKMAKARW